MNIVKLWHLVGSEYRFLFKLRGIVDPNNETHVLLDDNSLNVLREFLREYGESNDDEDS